MSGAVAVDMTVPMVLAFGLVWGTAVALSIAFKVWFWIQKRKAS